MASDSASPDQSPPSESSPPPPSSESSSSPPPPSPDSPPSESPPPPSEGDNNNNNNNNNNGSGDSSSSSSPPPPDGSSGSSGSSQSPPPPSSSSEQPQTPPSSEGGAGSTNQPPPTEEPRTPSQPGGGPQEGQSHPGENRPPLVPGAPMGPTNQTPPALGGDTNSTPKGSSFSSSHHGALTLGIVGVVVLLLAICCCILLCFRRKKKKGGGMPPYGWENETKPQGNQYWQTSPQDHAVKIPPGGESGPHSGPNMSSSLAPSPSLTLGFNKSTFTYDELAAATKGFDNSNMLGQGGFGYVHKGVLPNGKEIAVKSLKSGSGQGEREFQSEVEIISRVHHRHLVSLVGYCIAGGQRMLVYEFVPNDTLEFHLHKRGDLDFATRLRIALGSAKGLGYLHEDCHPRIIHRDIKASNILLDDNFEAMVADFGLAKLTTDTNTHVSTRVMGTFGYLAPEYASSGKLTEKSDVFSYGVMLLELITGRRPVDPNMKYMEDSLVDWSRPLLAKALETGNYDELVDPRLEGNFNPQEMQRMVACAAASICHSAKRRPKMSQIVRALEGDVSLEDLNEGTKTGGASAMYSVDGSSDYDTRAYSADLKKFRQMAFATQDFASSEYGGTSSEYGLNPSTSSSDTSREMTTRKLP